MSSTQRSGANRAQTRLERRDATGDAPTERAADPESGPYGDAQGEGDARADGHETEEDGSEGHDASRDGQADARDGQADASDGGTRDAMTGDAAKDAGGDCGPLDTVSNCGACGVACASTPSSPGVSTSGCPTGSTCQYTCKAGYLDCNGSVAPDTDGCECATPGSISATCCGTACPTEHVSGFSTGPSGKDQTFYDCQKTVDRQVAMDACTAYSGAASYCGDNSCVAPDGGVGDLLICNLNDPNGDTCACWNYQGAHAGWAVNSGTFTCYCPSGLAGEVQYH